MKGKLFFFIVITLLLLLSGTNPAQSSEKSEAETSAQSSFVEVILGFAILLLVCGCFFYTKKIESFLKGGELSFGWFLILISFLILIILQFIELGNSINVLKFDSDLYSFLKLIWMILLGWGLYRLKKVLS